MSTEAMLAQLSDEEDMNEDSNFQFAIVGDENCSHIKDQILEFLHQKDLLSSVDINEVYMKNSMTVLLAVEEDLPDSQVERINKVLLNHKDFKSYKMVNWATYHSIHRRNSGSYDDEDDDGDSMLEVADNYMRPQRNAIVNRRKNVVHVKTEEEIREDYSKMDKE